MCHAFADSFVGWQAADKQDGVIVNLLQHYTNVCVESEANTVGMKATVYSVLYRLNSNFDTIKTPAAICKLDVESKADRTTMEFVSGDNRKFSARRA